jgi:2-keto-4-pentenoate hydratase/2-oxohepta-3-ene-1,7-dioic acid hydratase in catechol pathway
MRLATIRYRGRAVGALRIGVGYLPLTRLNHHTLSRWPTQLGTLIERDRLRDLTDWLRSGGRRAVERMDSDAVPIEQVRYAPLYRRPRKIWGIGLNYASHASDLNAQRPTDIPASFMKPDTTIVGHGDTIRIPVQSHRTTAEAEIGVVIGTRCTAVARRRWRDYVAGFTSVLDMTAEDILRRNPRYLTVSKSFDTFFSLGPELVTPDEIADLSTVKVQTVLNGRICAENVVSQMTFSPGRLVAFHSQVMTLLPGDIISTGTPGAVVIGDGDRIESRITGFAPLVNSVLDLKSPQQTERRVVE